jgi:hypothetical protein
VGSTLSYTHESVQATLRAICQRKVRLMPAQVAWY